MRKKFKKGEIVTYLKPCGSQKPLTLIGKFKDFTKEGMYRFEENLVVEDVVVLNLKLK